MQNFQIGMNPIHLTHALLQLDSDAAPWSPIRTVEKEPAKTTKFDTLYVPVQLLHQRPLPGAPE
jgi:hypothetical protein